MHRVCPVLLLLLLGSKSCGGLSLELGRTHPGGGARRAAVRPSATTTSPQFRVQSGRRLGRRHDWRVELATSAQHEERVKRARQHHPKAPGNASFNSCTQQGPVASQRGQATELWATTQSVDEDSTTTTRKEEGDLPSNIVPADPANVDGDEALSVSNAQAASSISTTTTDEDDSDDDIVPSVAQILRFAVPAVGVWLCSPLLSMIDTSVVGLFSGTLQQAALNPAVAGECWR